MQRQPGLALSAPGRHVIAFSVAVCAGTQIFATRGRIDVTEYNLTLESVQELVQLEVQTSGRYLPGIDARLASELLRATGERFIVRSYQNERECVFRRIAVNRQWSVVVRIENNSWLKRPVIAAPERAAAVGAPETKEPDTPQEKRAGSSRSTGRKNRRS